MVAVLEQTLLELLVLLSPSVSSDSLFMLGEDITMHWTSFLGIYLTFPNV